MGRQTQKLLYQAIDEDTGKEVIGLEFRRGLMTPEQMKADEALLLPMFVEFVGKAQENANATTA